MILDLLQNIHQYSSLHPGLPAAVEFLHSIDPDAFTSGRRDIMGERMYAKALTKFGTGVADVELEAHRKYIDLQFSVAGIDNIGWKPIFKCLSVSSDYDSDRDVIYYSDVPDTWFGLVPGSCAIFFPQDAHAPLAVNGALHKIVVKIQVDW